MRELQPARAQAAGAVPGARDASSGSSSPWSAWPSSAASRSTGSARSRARSEHRGRPAGTGRHPHRDQPRKRGRLHHLPDLRPGQRRTRARCRVHRQPADRSRAGRSRSPRRSPSSGAPCGRSPSSAPVRDARAELASATELAFAASWQPGPASSSSIGSGGADGPPKSPKDVVTEVDHLSERLILDAVREAFPTMGCWRRSRGGGRAERPGAGGRPARRDDQLRQRHPDLLVSIGLVVDGVPSVGVVRDPVRGRRLGQGRRAATLAGRRSRASTKD